MSDLGEELELLALPDGTLALWVVCGRSSYRLRGAWCVRLVEPSIDGWDMEADARRFDQNLDSFLDDFDKALDAHITNTRGHDE